ncbi:hypothetical protein [Methylomonas methanica]|uniref:Uncharacterized protein n=1 Tax=Methylomonas methanica (strain DSM 25384 / MC09) TaxID=857087 RepID=F9ZY55_METMM|nr:hypothetical protein [Methylomonas methanica]AEF99785.1 hypothetical protein Metme_1362 [Methylomonas methanica MC09]
MKIYEKNISLFTVIVIATCLVIAIFSIAYFYSVDKTDQAIEAILSGLISGGVIFLIQISMDAYKFKVTDKYRRLGVTDILGNKKERKFYGNLILSTNTDIKMLGKTAKDLLDDFAHEDSDDEISKALLVAIEKQRKIQFLLAHEDYLDESHKADLKSVKSQLTLLQKNENFTVKYYNHIPAHSIFIVDNTCIVGPIFTGKSNRETPAIHLERHSQLAKHYEDYFDSEWEICEK